jgi:hypothetical protein
VDEHDAQDLALDVRRRDAQACRVDGGAVDERAAMRGLAIGVRVDVPVALKKLALRVVPHGLGVEQEAVHVEDGGAKAPGEDECGHGPEL